MTDLDILADLTDEEILQQYADQFDACQHGTRPFTPAELKAITRYGHRAQGIPDAIAGMDADSIRAFGDHALDTVRSFFRLLDDWQEAYTVLKLDGLPRDDEGDFSPAAVRFLGKELVDLQDAGRALHAALAEYVLGRDEFGYPYGSLAPSGGYRHVDGMFWILPA